MGSSRVPPSSLDSLMLAYTDLSAPAKGSGFKVHYFVQKRVVKKLCCTTPTSRALPSKTSSEKLHEQCTSTVARRETGATLEEILRQSLEVVLVQARVKMGNREQQRQKGQIRMSGETLQASAQPPLLPCQDRVTLQILDPPTAQT